MTRLGLIAILFAKIESPPSRFTPTNEYREWRERAIAWAGDAEGWELHQRVLDLMPMIFDAA